MGWLREKKKLYIPIDEKQSINKGRQVPVRSTMPLTEPAMIGGLVPVTGYIPSIRSWLQLPSDKTQYSPFYK